MTECEECAALEGANALTSPHASLLLHSDALINYGATASGRIEYYKCNRCGTKWERVRARSEPDARWRRSSKEF
jgi:hypothetical protein